MVKEIAIAIASFYFLVGFATATKNRPEMGNEDSRILTQDNAASSLLMISSEELADFDLGGSLSHLLGTEMDPENPPGTGTKTKSSKLDSKNAKLTESKSTKTNESKSTKTKSAKGKEPEPQPSPLPSEAPLASSAPSCNPTNFCCANPDDPFCPYLLSEGELPVQEHVPLDRRLEIIKSMEPFGAKPDATFSQGFDLILKKSCDSLIQHMETSLQRDIVSGVELLPVLLEAEDAYESWTQFEEGGIDNIYNKKLCECVSCINAHYLNIIYQTDVCILLFCFDHKTPTNLLH